MPRRHVPEGKKRHGVSDFGLLPDPAALAGDVEYLARLAMLADAAAEDGVRLPGDRRTALAAKAAAHGLAVPDALWAEITG